MRRANVTVPARSSARSSATKWLAGVVLLLALAASDTPRVSAQASVLGQWTTLPYLMPINPVHPTLLNNGRVLIVAGSGNVAAETNFRSTIWDPQAGTFSTRSHAWDMFCNGAVVLPDGRVLINGGNQQYDPFRGYRKNAVYDPATDTFTDVENMTHGRWYPTPTVLGDGSVMTFSGLNELTGATNTAVEIYTVGSGWSQEYPAGWTPPLYPRMHLLSDGRVFYSGSGRGSRLFNPSNKTWSPVVATTNFSGTRNYGTSVLLPLSASNGYASRVMIFGGGNPATNSTEIIDLSAATPQWQWGPAMSQGRIELNATILPNGKVLVMGGSVNDEDAATASLNADLYDPKTNTFSPAGANSFPRLYHSGSLLLPDGTVALMGGNPTRGSYEQHIEIYSPAYLFDGNGSPAIRPTVGHSSDTMHYGYAFQVPTPNADQIRSVGTRPARFADACVRYGPAARRALVHHGVGLADRDRAAPRQHRATGLLHALHPELGRRAVGGSLRPTGDRDPCEPGADGDHRQPVVEHDHQSRRIDLVRRLWLRSRRERRVVRMELRRRQSGREHPGNTGGRDLLHAWQLFGVSHRDRQRRRRERSRHANDHRRRLLPFGHAGVPQRAARSGHDVHGNRGADQWIHGQRQLRRTRPPLRRQRVLHAGFGVERWLDDARGVDERFYAGRYLHAHHPRHEWPDHEEHERHSRCGRKLFALHRSAEPDRTHDREHDVRRHADSRKRVHGSRHVLDQRLAEVRHRAVLAIVGHDIGNDDIDARHQEERRAGNVPLTVSGTSNGQVHSAPITLTVR